MKGRIYRHDLRFKRPSGTSRGVLTTKETWFLVLEQNGKTGIGECGLLRTLSVDDRPDYEEKLRWLCDHLHLSEAEIYRELTEFPSIVFGWEQAVRSLEADDPFVLFPSDFTSGRDAISINGLIWMGDPDFMQAQIEDKLKEGFTCIKMKIGAIDFETEIGLIKELRKRFSSNEVELRVDANGAFAVKDALDKLERLSAFDLHSIEQPIKAGDPEAMADLCRKTPLPVALDEELIGVFSRKKRKELLETIRPQYIILKPSLVGGFKSTTEWIELAGEVNAGWWITSALESNIGLNAISQYTYEEKNPMPQGLGTGGLYTNNIASPLIVERGKLRWDPQKKWELPEEWGVTF